MLQNRGVNDGPILGFHSLFAHTMPTAQQFCKKTSPPVIQICQDYPQLT